MTSSQDLQKLFTAQRQRREHMAARLEQKYPRPVRSRKHTPLWKLLGVVICTLVIALGIVSAFTLEINPVGAEKTSAPAEIQTNPPAPTVPVTQKPSAPLEAVTTAHVCTGEAGGHLHVRFEPGEGAAVRGYLSENESVRTSGESVAVRDGTWVSLLSPIEGWVNARYICKGD